VVVAFVGGVRGGVDGGEALIVRRILLSLCKQKKSVGNLCQRLPVELWWYLIVWHCHMKLFPHCHGNGGQHRGGSMRNSNQSQMEEQYTCKSYDYIRQIRHRAFEYELFCLSGEYVEKYDK
jgi:hypothetical protein